MFAAILLSVTAFSVSYAEWVGKDAPVAASGSIGFWTEGPTTEDGRVRLSPNGNTTVSISDYQSMGPGYFCMNVRVSKGGSFRLSVDGVSVALPVISSDELDWLELRGDTYYSLESDYDITVFIDYNGTTGDAAGLYVSRVG